MECIIQKRQARQLIDEKMAMIETPRQSNVDEIAAVTSLKVCVFQTFVQSEKYTVYARSIQLRSAMLGRKLLQKILRWQSVPVLGRSAEDY